MTGTLKMTILKKRAVDESVLVQPLHFSDNPFYTTPIYLQNVNNETVDKELANLKGLPRTEELKPVHFPNDTIVYYDCIWYKVVGQVVHGHNFILDVRKCFDDDGHDITLTTHTEHINSDKLTEDIAKTLEKYVRSLKLPLPDYDKLSMYEKAVAYSIIVHAAE